MIEINDVLVRRELLIAPFQNSVPALFLDRDGVVIEDCHHINDPEQVQLCHGARELVASAREQGWPVILVTNQSGISRGFLGWDDVNRVNQRMVDLLGADAPIAAIYANGYGPNAPKDSWRKPSPRMILDAADVLNLKLDCSLLIGDRLSDIQAGAAAWLAGLFHVLSGHGREVRPSILRWQAQASQSAPQVKFLDGLDSFPLETFQLASRLIHRN